MKVLMLNGSPKAKGNTGLALEEIGKQLEKEGIDYEIFQLGGGPVRDCIGCNRCTDDGCVFTDDGVNEFLAKAREADGFVFGTPVYYAHPSGRILSFLDRVFYSSSEYVVQQTLAVRDLGDYMTIVIFTDLNDRENFDHMILLFNQ